MFCSQDNSLSGPACAGGSGVSPRLTSFDRGVRSHGELRVRVRVRVRVSDS